jgi:hypothetical protein
MTFKHVRAIAAAGVLAALVPAAGWASPDAPAAESRRMARAKDFIADEQWTRAIAELRAAAADPKEAGKAEALFWLAHSLNQESDFAASVETIRQLEREHPSSPWVKPARSLLIELAQKLKREDVLWWTAARPHEFRAAPAAPRELPPHHGPGARPARATPPPSAPAAVAPAQTPTRLPAPPGAWVVDTWSPDVDQRIQALGNLIHTDAGKVIPLLRNIALEENDPGAARRAVFVLAHSRKPEALSIVVEVAKRGADPVRVEAVRGLRSFAGPEVSKALLQVYYTASAPLKQQVVKTLGERSEAQALLRIAQSEGDQSLRAMAILALGRAGGRELLLALYWKADRESKRPIINGLFTARAEDELIRIAEKETDRRLRSEVVSRLRLLGTPKAREYLAR